MLLSILHKPIRRPHARVAAFPPHKPSLNVFVRWVPLIKLLVSIIHHCQVLLIQLLSLPMCY